MYALAQNCVPIEPVKAEASRLARDSQSAAAAQFERTDAARQLANVSKALATAEHDQGSAVRKQSIAETALEAAARLGDTQAIQRARGDLCLATTELAGVLRERQILEAAVSETQAAAITERELIAKQARARFVDDMSRRADKARAVIVKALENSDVTAAIVEFSLATYLTGIARQTGELTELAVFRPMPRERAPGADDETVSSGVPSGPRRAGVGLPIG
ncbi:MAG: hypothetical protein ACM3U2_06990 [Deltaproteobacteria bacterium]